MPKGITSVIPSDRQSTRHHLNYVAHSPTHPLTVVSSHISSRRLPIRYLNPFPPCLLTTLYSKLPYQSPDSSTPQPIRSTLCLSLNNYRKMCHRILWINSLPGLLPGSHRLNLVSEQYSLPSLSPVFVIFANFWRLS